MTDDDPVLLERIHSKVSEAYTTLEDMLSNPERMQNPFKAMMGFARVIERLKEALSLLEGKG